MVGWLQILVVLNYFFRLVIYARENSLQAKAFTLTVSASEKEEPGQTAPRTEPALEWVCACFYLQLKSTLVNNRVLQVHSPMSDSVWAHVASQDNSHGILIIFLSFLCCFTKVLLTSHVESAGIKETPEACTWHYDSSVLICLKELSTTFNYFYKTYNSRFYKSNSFKSFHGIHKVLPCTILLSSHFSD